MINFNSLELVVHDTYSFVGIRKEKDTLLFFLPKGFHDEISSLNTFSAKRNTFFLFYRIFSVFKDICIDRGYLDESYRIGTQDRDGVISNDRGSLIEYDEDESENIFYSKLDIIGQLVSAYNEPKILSLAYRIGRSNKVNLGKIYQYLHQAVYLPNHAAYVDEMVLPKQVVQFESTDIITMYCYLYCEVKQQLEETVSGEIAALSERFRQHYLGSEDSLFDEMSYEQVLNALKDALEVIDHNTVVKDADYWQYYDAIELFLYGDWQQREDGEIWGIKNFHAIWESMCLTYLVDITPPSFLLHIDTSFLSNQSVSKVNTSKKAIDLKDVFTLNGKSLVPDAVTLVPLGEQLKVTKSYALSEDNWNDHGFYTTFANKHEEGVTVCIAYREQETGVNNHTITKLKEIYSVNGRGDVVVDSRLPENYYSYWNLPKRLDENALHRMYYLNHFFFLAIERGITDWSSFLKDVLQPFGIFRYPLEKNVFTFSIFRYDFLTRETVKEDFEKFVTLLPCKPKESIRIIDVKYFRSSYFQEKDNIEEIKIRSVRKQFVYEHLLQKELELKQTNYRNMSIQSVFWLPDYRPDDSNLLADGAEFLDGFIQLADVNFMILARNYI